MKHGKLSKKVSPAVAKRYSEMKKAVEAELSKTISQCFNMKE